MKPQTVSIVKFAIAAKFGTAFFLCPFLTFGQQLRCVSLPPISFGDKNPFKISDGRALGSFNKIEAQPALCKSDRLIINESDKTDSIIIHN